MSDENEKQEQKKTARKISPMMMCGLIAASMIDLEYQRVNATPRKTKKIKTAKH